MGCTLQLYRDRTAESSKSSLQPPWGADGPRATTEGGTPWGVPFGGGEGQGGPCPPQSPKAAGLAPAGPSLGTIAKSCNPPSSTFPERRLERWALQSVSRSLLPRERVKHCLRSPQKGENSVEIFKSREHDSFHFSKLQTCGSVWHCPVCAGKISERRRVELVEGVRKWREGGGGVNLLTLTVPHYSHNSLASVLDGISGARRRLLNRKPWKRLAASIGLEGQIRALEVTYGENGWHVHFHVLCFLSAPLEPSEMMELQATILEQWQSACNASGLPVPNHHGVSLDDGNKAAQYVGKWGLEHEMTKAHIKKSREGYTPFDLLRVVLGTYNGSSSLLDQGRAARVFQEYAVLFKGKRQLVWSDGFRDLLGLDDELTDEELASVIEDDAVKFASIPLDVWRIILKAERRGELLEVCRQGLDALHDFIIGLCESDGYFGNG